MTINIPVSASFDASNAEQQLAVFSQKLNELGRRIAQANSVQFNPVNQSSIDDVKKMAAQFETMLRLQADFRRRVASTGQTGKSFVDLDWAKLYPNQHSRNRQMQQAFQYVTGQQFNAANDNQNGATGGGGNRTPPPPPPRTPAGAAPSPAAGPSGPSVGQVGLGVAQAGLRGANGFTGGASGVAANALESGSSLGMGAGLMGLVGGMLALGIGKIISTVTEKVGQAEDNNVGYDKLKRTIGDVNVSFTGLKSILEAAASNTKITFAETSKLGLEFTKLGNISADQYKTIGRELETGIGFSRGFGLDPEKGVQAFGQARGVGALKNEQDTRRYALLIGETIGKSGAFAKADEVLDAVGQYTVSQTRQGMGAANMAGYAGTFSALTGSGIPGLDVGGTSALMARINATMSAGGGKGEASQFFTNTVGQKMGLNSIQTQILREGGAHATNDEAFGEGSIAKRYGISGPSGNKTFLQGSLDELRKQYKDPGQLAQATANHLGINMRQAMAVLSVKPNEMGEMQKFGDVSKLSSSGIGNLSKVLFGGSADRSAMADSLKRRTGADALSQPEMARLDEAMKSGNAETQKKVLAELISSHDYERTMGSDIRDSKAVLDNIKVALADKLVPLTQEMRQGIMSIAGADKGKSPDEIMKGVINAESKGRSDAISGKQDSIISELLDKRTRLQTKNLTTEDAIRTTYRDNPEMMNKKLAERKQNSVEIENIEKKLVETQKEKDRLLTEENDRRKKEISNMEKNSQARYDAEKQAEKSSGKSKAQAEIENAALGPSDRRFSTGSGPGGIGIRQSTASSLNDIKNPEEKRNVKSFLDLLSSTEGAGYNTLVGGSKIGDLSKHPAKVGLRTGDGPSTAAGRYQITGTTWKSLGHGGNASFSPENQDAGAIELIKRRGAWGDVLKGDWKAAAGKLGDEWVSLPSSKNKNQGHKSWEYAEKNWEAARARNRTPLPTEAADELRRETSRMQQGGTITAEPLRVIHENTKGEQIKPQETLKTTVKKAAPFGVH